MKIALVHEMLIRLGGAERVLKALTEMFPEAPVFTLFKNAAAEEGFKGKTIITSRLQPWLNVLGSHRPLLPFMPAAVEAWDFSGYDLVISSSSAFAHGIKTAGKTKHLCYCHSPMRYAWDYSHEYLKGASFLKRFAAATLLHNVRQWDYKSATRPDVILANSGHVQKRIAKYWRRTSQILYPPVDVRQFTPKRTSDGHFLIVSNLTPFKRIDLAVRTFTRLKKPLIVIGDGPQKKDLQSIAGPTISFLGHQPDSVVKDALESCRALIFPGEEDFGITPVEAMAAGKPVLAYGTGGVKESVVPGVSGEFFNEPTPESLEAGLTQLLLNEPQYDYRKIRALAERFDEGIFKDRLLQECRKLTSQ